MDEARNSLYIGAMDRVIRVNLGNVSATSCEYDSLLLEASNVAACVAKGKSESFDCRNHIRVIQPIGAGDRLYICGTNAHNPQVRESQSLGVRRYISSVYLGREPCHSLGDNFFESAIPTMIFTPHAHFLTFVFISRFFLCLFPFFVLSPSKGTCK
jgi:hypothetical protein